MAQKLEALRHIAEATRNFNDPDQLDADIERFLLDKLRLSPAVIEFEYPVPDGCRDAAHEVARRYEAAGGWEAVVGTRGHSPSSPWYMRLTKK